MNSRGPRTSSLGYKQAHEERWLSYLTRKVRDDKYDLNQFKTDPWIPISKPRRQASNQNVMVDGIKCSRKVKKTETG